MAALALCFASTAFGDTYDYSADDTIRSSLIDVADSAQMTTVGGFMDLVESQSTLRFVRTVPGDLLDAGIVLPIGDNVALSRLLWTVSLQANVVFQRRGSDLIARPLESGDIVATPSDIAQRYAQDAGVEDEVVMLEAVTVEGETYNQDVALVEKRLLEVKFQNFLSSDDFKRYGASDVGEAISRVAGINVTGGGRFAVIRGLSERYSATMLNGVPVPTSDPEKQGVHLDLFSADIVDNLEITKTFSPDGPGNAAGGYINIITTWIPDDFYVSVSGGLAFNENAHDDWVGYDYPSSDWRLANGSNDRFTSVFNEDGAFVRASSFTPIPNSTSVNLPEDVDMIPDRKSAPAAYNFSVSAGGGRTLFGHKVKLGGTLAYDSSFKTEAGVFEARYPSIWSATSGGAFSYYSDLWYGTLSAHSPKYEFVESAATVSLTALGALQVELDKQGAHSVTLNTFFSQVGEDVVSKYEDGTWTQEDPDVDAEREIGPAGRLRSRYYEAGEAALEDIYYWDFGIYEERQLTTTQLVGNHAFDVPGEGSPLKVDWALSRSNASTGEPDARSVEYVYYTEGGNYLISKNSDDKSNQYRSWREIGETQDFARMDLERTFFFGDALSLNLQAGGSHEDSAREVVQGRVNFQASVQRPTIEEIFSPDTRFTLANSNRNVDAEASRRISAGYLNTTFTLFSRFDLIAGFRVERLNMSSDANILAIAKPAYESIYTATAVGLAELFDISPAENGSYLNGSIDSVFFLPSVGAAVRATDNLVFRLNYAESVARPSLREITPYLAFIPESLDNTFGNPQLETSDVRSVDFRAEYLAGKDLAAISLFYKEVDRPIEQIRAPNNVFDEFVTWVNNENTAVLKGIEFEVRKRLDFTGVEFLNDFSIGGNYTYIDAEVGVPQPLLDASVRAGATYWRPNNFQPTDDAIFTEPNPKRRLYDQPEWIVNADISYENERSGTRITLAYYAISEILSSAGLFVSVPANSDEYSDDYNRVDLTIRQRLFKGCRISITAKNLTDSRRGTLYDPYITTQDYYKSVYRVGRDYSVSITYDF